jgi:hypothetical protein
MNFESRNPATGELLGVHPEHDKAETDARLQRAWDGWRHWSRTPLQERIAFLTRLAEALAYKDGPFVVDVLVDPFALSLPSHVPFHATKGFTLSLAKQVLSGRLDSVIKTIERNVRLV